MLVGKFSRKVSMFDKSFQLAFQEMFISLSMRFSSLNLGDNAQCVLNSLSSFYLQN